MFAISCLVHFNLFFGWWFQWWFRLCSRFVFILSLSFALGAGFFLLTHGLIMLIVLIVTGRPGSSDQGAQKNHSMKRNRDGIPCSEVREELQRRADIRDEAVTDSVDYLDALQLSPWFVGNGYLTQLLQEVGHITVKVDVNLEMIPREEEALAEILSTLRIPNDVQGIMMSYVLIETTFHLVPALKAGKNSVVEYMENMLMCKMVSHVPRKCDQQQVGEEGLPSYAVVLSDELQEMVIDAIKKSTCHLLK